MASRRRQLRWAGTTPAKWAIADGLRSSLLSPRGRPKAVAQKTSDDKLRSLRPREWQDTPAGTNLCAECGFHPGANHFRANFAMAREISIVLMAHSHGPCALEIRHHRGHRGPTLLSARSLCAPPRTEAVSRFPYCQGTSPRPGDRPQRLLSSDLDPQASRHRLPWPARFLGSRE